MIEDKTYLCVNNHQNSFSNLTNIFEMSRNAIKPTQIKLHKHRRRIKDENFEFRKKVQVDNDQEKAQSERNSYYKNRGGKN